MQSAFVFALLVLSAQALSLDTSDKAWRERPVQKVVGMLKEMKAQLDAEAEADQEMFGRCVERSNGRIESQVDCAIPLGKRLRDCLGLGRGDLRGPTCDPSGNTGSVSAITGALPCGGADEPACVSTEGPRFCLEGGRAAGSDGKGPRRGGRTAPHLPPCDHRTARAARTHPRVPPPHAGGSWLRTSLRPVPRSDAPACRGGSAEQQSS